MSNVTVLCGRERRRRWTTAEKLRLVADSLSAGLSVAAFARRHDVHPKLLHVWRRQAQAGELSFRLIIYPTVLIRVPPCQP
jgi:transposase